eukprot:230209-Prymnesium_polylepis.1
MKFVYCETFALCIDQRSDIKEDISGETLTSVQSLTTVSRLLRSVRPFVARVGTVISVAQC